MWTISSDFSCAIDQFVGFTPSEVLYEFEGPRIFTTLNGSQLYFWYECSEEIEANRVRYLVVPANRQLVEHLKCGSKTVHDALRQPWLWVIDVVSGQVDKGWVLSDMESIPAYAKPHPDAPLWPQLEPLLSYRLIGDGLREGVVPASVVARAIAGPTAALKGLLEIVNNAGATVGRPAEESRKLYGVVAKRFAFNSFEISFDMPPQQDDAEQSYAASQASLPLGGETASAVITSLSLDASSRVPSTQLIAPSLNIEIYQEGGAKLEQAFKWLASENSSIAQPTLSMLSVLESLVPPKNGQITAAEVKGKLVGELSSVMLTRDSTTRVKRAIANSRERQRTLVSAQGRIGEFDKDKLTCTLRDQPDHKPEIVCSFTEAIYDDLLDAFNTDKMVIIQGRKPAERRMEIIAVELAELPSSPSSGITVAPAIESE